MIDYALAKKEGPKLKAALTRASKKDYAAVLAACRHAVTRWNAWGAWPDNWHRWQVALDDAASKHNHGARWQLALDASTSTPTCKPIGPREYVTAPRLESL